MSLYGRTDSNANKTKAGVGIAASSQTKTVVYVDETEAALEANKERGLNAPGWWSYFTYTDHSGATRHKAEQLIFVAGGDTNANETQADDAQAADAASASHFGTTCKLHLLLWCSTFTLTTATTGTPGALALCSHCISGRRTLATDTGITSGASQQHLLLHTVLAAILTLVKYRVKINSAMVVKKSSLIQLL